MSASADRVASYRLALVGAGADLAGTSDGQLRKVIEEVQRGLTADVPPSDTEAARSQLLKGAAPLAEDALARLPSLTSASEAEWASVCSALITVSLRDNPLRTQLGKVLDDPHEFRLFCEQLRERHASTSARSPPPPVGDAARRLVSASAGEDQGAGRSFCGGVRRTTIEVAIICLLVTAVAAEVVTLAGRMHWFQLMGRSQSLRNLDEDDDGHVDFDEFEEGARRIQQHVPREKVIRVFQEADRDGDERLSPGEVLALGVMNGMVVVLPTTSTSTELTTTHFVTTTAGRVTSVPATTTTIGIIVPTSTSTRRTTSTAATTTTPRITTSSTHTSTTTTSTRSTTTTKTGTSTTSTSTKTSTSTSTTSSTATATTTTSTTSSTFTTTSTTSTRTGTTTTTTTTEPVPFNVVDFFLGNMNVICLAGLGMAACVAMNMFHRLGMLWSTDHLKDWDSPESYGKLEEQANTFQDSPLPVIHSTVLYDDRVEVEPEESLHEPLVTFSWYQTLGCLTCGQTRFQRIGRDSKEGRTRPPTLPASHRPPGRLRLPP